MIGRADLESILEAHLDHEIATRCSPLSTGSKRLCLRRESRRHRFRERIMFLPEYRVAPTLMGMLVMIHLFSNERLALAMLKGRSDQHGSSS